MHPSVDHQPDVTTGKPIALSKHFFGRKTKKPSNRQMRQFVLSFLEEKKWKPLNYGVIHIVINCRVALFLLMTDLNCQAITQAGSFSGKLATVMMPC